MMIDEFGPPAHHCLIVDSNVRGYRRLHGDQSSSYFASRRASSQPIEDVPQLSSVAPFLLMLCVLLLIGRQRLLFQVPVWPPHSYPSHVPEETSWIFETPVTIDIRLVGDLLV